jgi:tetraacyldisaccharide 4'-kinase
MPVLWLRIPSVLTVPAPMIQAPKFWTRNGWLAHAIAPLSCIGAAITSHRMARAGWQAPVPVICCGNATVGGAGKTTLALDLAHRLIARGIAVHVLLRGYGGAARGPRRVQAGDTAAVTGDEALLLAAVAPTWTGADRAASAQAAVAAGAEVLLMDDGLQNPSLEKTISLLVVDGAAGFGNGRVLPAGPLREPVAAAAARCRAAVLIGPDLSGAAAALPLGLPVLRAELAQDAGIAEICGRRVLAFAGIAFPEKFFAGLERAGVVVAGRAAFADHHAFTTMDLTRLARKAREMNAVLITTPKDAVRLPAGTNVYVADVHLVWENTAALESLLDGLIVAGSGRRSAAS